MVAFPKLKISSLSLVVTAIVMPGTLDETSRASIAERVSELMTEPARVSPLLRVTRGTAEALGSSKGRIGSSRIFGVMMTGLRCECKCGRQREKNAGSHAEGS